MLNNLKGRLEGELLADKLTTTLYATDASVYRKIPMAVAYPKSEGDIKNLILFARENKVGLIPRTAGTSLAGQCVGDGIVVDVSKYFTKILSLDTVKKQVTVQPGVIRDVLNMYLATYVFIFYSNILTT